MRRFPAVLAALITCAVVSSAIPANATCIVEPFERVVDRSDAVWYGTVIAAEPSSKRSLGYWRETVKIADVLKGPPAGNSAVVYASSCGPYMTPRMIREAAVERVGGDQLFLLTRTKDGYQVYSEVLSPQGMSAQEQLELAQVLLGHPPRAGVNTTSGGTSSRWPFVAVVIAVLVLLAILSVVLRRRRTDGLSRP